MQRSLRGKAWQSDQIGRSGLRSLDGHGQLPTSSRSFMRALAMLEIGDFSQCSLGLPSELHPQLERERVILAVTICAEGGAVVQAQRHILADLRIEPQAERKMIA